MRKLLLYALKSLLFMYIKTLRITVVGKATVEKMVDTTPCVFLLWHDSLLLTPLLTWLGTHRSVCILISKSHDGDIASELAALYKNIFVLRVAHKARTRALLESCALLQNNTSLLITPDGPRGPRRTMKDGAIFAAMKTQVPIVPITWNASWFFSLPTWDSFRIPLPFSKVTFSFLPPQISLSKEESLEAYKARVESIMQ